MSEIHRDSMSSVNLELGTDRLLLRPLVENDWEMALETFMDPEVMKFVADVGSEEALAEEMKTAIRRGAGGRIGVWCVLQRETGEKLGTAILLPLPIEEDDTDWSLVQEDRYPDADIEVGYILKRSAWGNGYATEACRRLVQFAFEETELDEIVAVTDPRNAASQEVLRKCGLRDEGLRRAYAEECPAFRISRQQWLELQVASV
ncbi:MAG: GNAT family N-acetyltransferase [Deltaproteobacteria bacterium]|nr:GNAT family N-acetyltransferase [Deltaproteobacteria bacterium]